MELRQLRTFCTVADTLSFTKTAEQLFMAQSSVSAQIRALEDDLDVKLFDRIGRRVFLTAAGEKLVQYARRMEAMTEEIKSEISGNSYIRGTLTIRVPETLATIYMPEIVNTFHKENPGVKLVFINCSDRQLREELNSGRIDLAFLMTDTIYFRDINVKMLKAEDIVLISGPTHPLAKQKKATLEEIGEQTVLFPRTD